MSQRVGHYVLGERLGQGSMGEVWRAHDERLGRDVAVKLLPPAVAASADRQARLLREAQAASHLNHPGIVTIHDVGTWEERLYIVMELIEGERFTELAEKDLPAARALALVAQVAEALSAAHDAGILHRDVKSDNLMVGKGDRVKVLDFGLAKLRARISAEMSAAEQTAAMAEAPEPELPPIPEDIGTAETITPEPSLASPVAVGSSLSGRGLLIGTPAYMSPEQARGRPIDARSEIYSVGLVLYELLSGARPLHRPTVVETVQAARAAEIPPLARARGRRVPRPVLRVLERALARDPEQRYPTMTELGRALRHAADVLGSTRRVRRRMVRTGALVIALSGAAALLARRSGREPTQPHVTAVHRLTSDPGCDENPALSADGRFVVYDGVVDGDTELLRIDFGPGLRTGERRRLTHAPGWDLGPVVSPDGRSIAYLHNDVGGRELRVIPAEGDEAAPPRRLGTTAGYGAWTLDGDVVAGDTEGRFVRWDLDEEDPVPRVLATLPSSQRYFSAAALPSGEIVVAVRTWLDSPVQVQLFRLADGELSPIAADATGLSRPIAAPAGDAVYFVNEPHLYTNEIVRQSLGREGARALVAGAVAPTGGIDVARSGELLAMSTCRQRLFLARLGAGQGYEPVFGIRDWNDDNFEQVDDRRFLVESDRSGRPQIWSVERGGEARPLFVESAREPALSPDGRQVAYVAVAPDEPGVWVRPLAGEPAVRLTRDPGDRRPRFTPDGATVLFARVDPATTSQLLAVPVAGGEPRLIADKADGPFAVAADGRVAWAELGSSRLRLSGVDGASLGVIDAAPDDYSYLQFAPDGTLLAVRHRTEIVEIPLAGGGPPRVVWSTVNDVVSDFAPASDGGLYGVVATYDGDLWLAEGEFR